MKAESPSALVPGQEPTTLISNAQHLPTADEARNVRSTMAARYQHALAPVRFDYQASRSACHEVDARETVSDSIHLHAFLRKRKRPFADGSGYTSGYEDNLSVAVPSVDRMERSASPLTSQDHAKKPSANDSGQNIDRRDIPASAAHVMLRTIPTPQRR